MCCVCEGGGGRDRQTKTKNVNKTERERERAGSVLECLGGTLLQCSAQSIPTVPLPRTGSLGQVAGWTCQ